MSLVPALWSPRGRGLSDFKAIVLYAVNFRTARHCHEKKQQQQDKNVEIYSKNMLNMLKMVNCGEKNSLYKTELGYIFKVVST